MRSLDQLNCVILFHEKSNERFLVEDCKKVSGKFSAYDIRKKKYFFRYIHEVEVKTHIII